MSHDDLLLSPRMCLPIHDLLEISLLLFQENLMGHVISHPVLIDKAWISVVVKDRITHIAAINNRTESRHRIVESLLVLAWGDHWAGHGRVSLDCGCTGVLAETMRMTWVRRVDHVNTDVGVAV